MELKARHQFSINLGLDSATNIMLAGTGFRRLAKSLGYLLSLAVLCAASSSNGDELQILKRNPDPFGYPRPAPAATHVPVGTSFFIQLGFQDKDTTDAVVADSVVVRLRSSDSDEVPLLNPWCAIRRRLHGQHCTEPRSTIRLGHQYRRRTRVATGNDVHGLRGSAIAIRRRIDR